MTTTSVKEAGEDRWSEDVSWTRTEKAGASPGHLLVP